MPKSFRTEAYFDPETVLVLSLALEDAWDKIANSGSTFARPFYARAAREVLAHRIIETAQDGETDVRRLSDDAVLFLVTNYKQ